MTPMERALLLHECGSVQRCHTVPHVGEYSVSSHSWGVVMLILALHPDPSFALVCAALTHDCAERFTGDIPGPMRRACSSVDFDLVESGIKRWLNIEIDDVLSTDDRNWMHAADKAELKLWCDNQMAMGNQHVYNMWIDMVDWSRKHRSDVPAPLREIFLRKPINWQRGPEYPFK